MLQSTNPSRLSYRTSLGGKLVIAKIATYIFRLCTCKIVREGHDFKSASEISLMGQSDEKFALLT